MTLEDQFKKAVEDVNSLTKRPDNDELLKLYGLYKQATEGDASSDAPGGFDFKAAAKLNAWKDLMGKDSAEAMQEYIDMVEILANKYKS